MRGSGSGLIAFTSIFGGNGVFNVRVSGGLGKRTLTFATGVV